MPECMERDIQIVEEAVDLVGLQAGATGRETDGAMASFVGTVRQSSGMKGREGQVVRLEYEAFAPMALAELGRIADEVEEEYAPTHLAIHHRVGALERGEVAVAIFVSTPHRAAAFSACRTVIEELKKRVPIWKKEVFADGAAWVDPRP